MSAAGRPRATHQRRPLRLPATSRKRREALLGNSHLQRSRRLPARVGRLPARHAHRARRHLLGPRRRPHRRQPLCDSAGPRRPIHRPGVCRRLAVLPAGTGDEEKLDAIIQDVKDAYRWVTDSGELMKRDAGLPIVALGHSAGGYLSPSWPGVHMRPPPKAIVSFYGYGDLVGPWYSKPDTFYCSQPAITREQALQAVGKGPHSPPVPGSTDSKRFLFLPLLPAARPLAPRNLRP